MKSRYLIDASGRGASAGVAHMPGRRWLRADRLVAIVGSMTAPAEGIEPVLVLEATQDGWWYSVPQPMGNLLAVLVTDSDLVRPRRDADLAELFLAKLRRTEHTAARCAGANLSAPPWSARADSGLLLPDRCARWRVVGDAAMSCDPLAGDGVAAGRGPGVVRPDRTLKSDRDGLHCLIQMCAPVNRAIERSEVSRSVAAPSPAATSSTIASAASGLGCHPRS